jgi:tetratricopeptide (TPR) repeat protein
MRITCPADLLTGLLNTKGVEQDLKYLFDAHLIESNLVSSRFWLSAHLHHHIHRLNLIPNSTLLAMGQELLQQLIAYQNDSYSQLRFIESGFQYCLLHLAELGELEYPLQRNLQFGKKYARKYQTDFRYTQNMLTSLELALQVRKGHLIQKTLFSLVEILEELPYAKETIAICDWLLAIEKKRRNWPLVSEIQTRMASIYAALNKKEKAIGYISSALKLNDDIKNFAGRYSNLISIALLLLDLEEFDKLTKLLTSANFDTSLLNKEDMARLWLIDGHMLYHNNKTKEAESSFKKVVNHSFLSVADSLLAKTHLYLAEIYNNRGDHHHYIQYLENALLYVQASGDQEKAVELHEELYELLIARDEVKGAVSHLEWIYRFYRENGNKAQIRKAADLLGGLYFKIGEHAKSTELYSVAQGV